MFYLQFETDNAAFEDDLLREISRILADISLHFEHRSDENSADGRIRDINGNTIGRWKLTGHKSPIQVAMYYKLIIKGTIEDAYAALRQWRLETSVKLVTVHDHSVYDHSVRVTLYSRADLTKVLNQWLAADQELTPPYPAGSLLDWTVDV
jgi:hypothetical protein